MDPSSELSNMSLEELEQEITFQTVMLNSIDDSVGNRAEAEREVLVELRKLKKERQRRKGGFSGRPAHHTSAAMDDDPFATLIGGDPFASSSGSPTSSTPSSGDISSLGTSRVHLPSRKRSHSKHLDGLMVFEDNKSRKTTPSRYDTGPTTPSTSSGHANPKIDDDWLDLTADDELIISEFAIQRQKQEEQRIKREREDAEFALSMSQSLQPASDFSPDIGSSTPGPSAFSRLAGMRQTPTSMSTAPQFGQSSSSSRIPGSSTAASRNVVNSSPWPATSSVKREEDIPSGMGFSSYSSRPHLGFDAAVKSEGPSYLNMPGSYRDDSSSTGDSDIEEIPDVAFYANVRRSAKASAPASGAGSQQQRPSLSHEAYAAGQAAHNRTEALLARPTMPSYGTHPSLVPGSYPGQAPGYSYSGHVPSSFGPGSLHRPSGQPFYNGSSPRGIGMNGVYGPGPGSGYMRNGSNALDLHSRGSGYDPLADMIQNSVTNFDELQGYLNLDDRYRGQLDYIVNDPRKSHQEIKELLENIRPDADLAPEDREGTPDGLKYPLYEHQKLALTWLKAMEEGTNKGGILADDMGLGKTISSLALLLSRPSTDPQQKSTLIVAPVALIRQWVREISTKVNRSHRLSVHMMHGQSKRLSWDDLKVYDVVLTTYGTLAAELGRWEKYLHQNKLNGNREVDVAASKKNFPLLGPKSTWYRILLDEAQCIKNKNTRNAKAACQLQAKTRFCLTGTPMMNNVGELYSLIHFLRIRPYNEQAKFQAEFGMLTRGKQSEHARENAMKKLQTVLKAILLRRTKTSLIDGKPIITLPPKVEEIQHVAFSEEEQAFYKALENKSQLQFNKYMKAGTVMKNYANVLVLLLRLRQCACHPNLIGDMDKAPPPVSADTLIELAKTLEPDVVNRIKEMEAFECPICYDAVENPKLVVPCGHDTCSECLAKIVDSAGAQNMANGEEDGGNTKCPTCRGKVDPARIIDYDAFKRAHMPELGKEMKLDIDDDETASEHSDSDDSDTASETDSESDINDAGDLRDFVVSDDMEDDTSNSDDENEAKPKKESKSEKKERKCRRKGKGKAKDGEKLKSLAELKREASRTIAGRKRYMKALEKDWQSSAKVDKCLELLKTFQDDGQKTIVFSQFVSLLDLVQVPIMREGWRCERYDGGMSANARNDACINFTDKADCKIMLISLKAGNAGLNLVAASRVIILDPFWNPYIEMQAVDRAYRIGQQRSVEVHRILVKETVEDRIIDLQEKKKALVNAALDEGAQNSLGRLDVRQLGFLFGVNSL
ncbi:hypothetical protein BP5796_09695 [Coleophoma crateriformis]|uniref:Uncharacterized protein n=1 Tax=Coleophoma crateriformis TaxID=565419 RepID=A0A3D8QYS0_9HELO|nr:hypothetical protein BP5796_09695 [Coleophoma crateriformis]